MTDKSTNEFNPDDYTPEELAYMAAQYDAEHPEMTEGTANKPLVNKVFDSLLSTAQNIRTAETMADINVAYDASVENQILPTAEDQCFDQLVGTKIGYYKGVRDDLKNGTKAFRINVCAFLATSAWFAYRKMYAHAVIIGLLEFAFSVGIAFMGGTTIAIRAFFGLACAMFANSEYIKSIDRRIQRYSQLQTEDEHKAFIRKRGGTNIGFGIVWFLFVKALPFALPVIWTLIVIAGLLTNGEWIEATDVASLLGL